MAARTSLRASHRLFWLLVSRDIKVRYTQTIGGFLWALIQPLALTLVFTMVFRRTLGISTGPESVPYPLFALTGVLPWTLFSTGLTRSTYSLVNDWPLVKKSAVPRVLLPLACAVAPGVDFAVSFLLVLPLMVYWHMPLMARIVAVVPAALIAMVFAAGLGLWLSAINARYRDVGWGLPFAVWMGMLASPVAYPSSMVVGHSRWEGVYMLNPMAGAIDGCRWAVLGGDFPGVLVLMSATVALGVLATGLLFFWSQNRSLADVI